MPIAMVAIGVASLGLSVYQTAEAKKKQKKMEEEAKNYKRQELTNPYEDLQVSTAGSDLQQQNLNTQVSTALDSLRSGGSRAILAGTPTLYDNIIKSNQQISASLDQQYNSNQRLEAEGNAMVQNMTENRENNDLIGIGTAINTYRQEYAQGLNNTAQSLGSTLSALAYTNGNKNQTIQNTTNETQAPRLGSTGLFGKSAVAISSNKFNNNLILPNTQITPNSPFYQDLIRQYNNSLYRR